MKTINSIILTIVTFLLTIFPWSSSLVAKKQQLTFPGNEIVINEIISAIETRDVSSLEEMYSKSQREEVDGLSNKIELLIDSIKGEMLEIIWLPSGGSDYKNYGVAESTRSWKLIFTTSEDEYIIYVDWVIVDTINPDRVGLIGLTLFDSVGYNETHEAIVQAH